MRNRAVPSTAVTEREFRRTLECGILAHGFARARCADYGHDFLIAYSCKCRGVCPSCTTRRMVETAAHLTDHVIPRLAVRQWVLSVPKRLRYQAALDPSRTAAALGIAVSMVGSVRQNFGTTTMALHVGLAARDAVHSMLLAEAGLTSDPAALEGKFGYFRAFANRKPDLPALGEPFELLDSGIIFKPYPSGAPTLAAVDAALALRAHPGFDLSSIERITCLVHPWNAITLLEEEPRNPIQAKVNMRFCVAAALVHGELTYRQFSQEAVDDPRLRSLMQRIDIEVSDTLPDSDEFPAEVRVASTDGRVRVEGREVPPGGSQRPLSEIDIVAKLRSCAESRLVPAALERVIGMVRGLEDIGDVRELCETLEGAPANSRVGRCGMISGVSRSLTKPCDA